MQAISAIDSEDYVRMLVSRETKLHLGALQVGTQEVGGRKLTRSAVLCLKPPASLVALRMEWTSGSYDSSLDLSDYFEKHSSD
ncbi:hypothetical protein ABIB35_002046 [Arthrobacter sp. UYP6]